MVVDLDAYFALPQYSLPRKAKNARLLGDLNRLTDHHRANCEPYRRILDASGHSGAGATSLPDVPFLPVGLFKHHELSSVAPAEVFKVLLSSGTTSQRPSRVVLDISTARSQARALSSIMTHYLGPRRLPMLIVDHPGVVKDRRSYSARGAAILGMMNFGRKHLFLLDEDMTLDMDRLKTWLSKYADQEILIFGLTSLVWQRFAIPLTDAGIDLRRATLIHSGGWKKLQDASVGNADFKAKLESIAGITRVHNFYGMVEQVGSIFMECQAGFFHPPNFADMRVRNPRTWVLADHGETGVVEVFSLLPTSYPGHALLTEDLGIVHGVDACGCGQLGRYFTITGRVPQTEIRGCSDTQTFEGAASA